MPRWLLTLPHVFSIVWLGLMAGFFWAYSINVSQALAQVDGATYAQVQSMLNRHVRHEMFFVFFFGPPLWVLLALGVRWRAWRQRWWWCLLAAGVLYALGIIMFTAQVNLPNNAYTESWNPSQLPADWAATRDQWRMANHWRTLASATSCLLACVALAMRPAGVVPHQPPHQLPGWCRVMQVKPRHQPGWRRLGRAIFG